MQDCSISIAYVLEIPQSCPKSSKCPLFICVLLSGCFRFLFENQSPAHIYYRWKLFSLLQVSDTISTIVYKLTASLNSVCSCLQFDNYKMKNKCDHPLNHQIRNRSVVPLHICWKDNQENGLHYNTVPTEYTQQAFTNSTRSFTLGFQHLWSILHHDTSYLRKVWVYVVKIDLDIGDSTWQNTYSSGHEGVAVLSPGFAINWYQNQVIRQPHLRDLMHMNQYITE